MYAFVLLWQIVSLQQLFFKTFWKVSRIIATDFRVVLGETPTTCSWDRKSYTDFISIRVSYFLYKLFHMGVSPLNLSYLSDYLSLMSLSWLELQTVQNKCIRYSPQLDNRSHIGMEDFEKINWLPVSKRFNQYLC